MKLRTKRGVKKLETDRALLQTVLDTVLANSEVADNTLQYWANVSM